MVSIGQDKWRMGVDLPEGILEVERQTVSGSGTDLLRSRAELFERVGRTSH